MKKIFFFILLLTGFFAQGQKLQKPTTYGYEFPRVLVNTSLGFPKDTFAIPTDYQNEQWWASKNGSLYRWDTIAYIWRIFGSPSEVCPPDGVFNGSASVTWQGTGYNFSVAPGLYMIDCVPFTSDSGSVTLATADPDFDRFDVIYLATDGAFHVLQGEPSASAAIPQVQGDEIALTAILVPAGSTAFEPNELIVYNHNTESTITNTGTTTNGANTTNTFTPTVSVNVTNINNGDIIFFTKIPGPSTWDITGVDILSLHVKLKAVMPTLGTLRVSFYNGSTTPVSAEVAVPIDRNNTTTYQAISIPISAFGNIQTIQFTQVRFRYTSNNANNYTGLYLDYISFVDNLPTLPPTGAQVNLTLHSNGNAIVINPSEQIQNGGTWNLLGGGNSSQYIDGTLTIRAFPTTLTTIGTVNGRTKATDGLVIDGAQLFGQDADTDDRGFLTSEGFNRLWTNYYISPAPGIGDSIIYVVPGNDSTTFVRNIIFGTAWGITATDILIDTTGGSGSGSSLLPTTGTGTATGDITGDLDGNAVEILDNNNGSNVNFSINNTTGTVFLQSYNTTGSDNVARVEGVTSNTAADATLIANFNGSASVASIVAHAESGVKTLTYTGNNIFSDVSAVSDTTGRDLLMRDRTTGEMVRVGVDELANQSPTLQQVFNTQVGGAVLTKHDSIQTGNFQIKLYGNFVPLRIESAASGAANFVSNTSSTNDIAASLSISHTTTGSAAAGIGSSIYFYNEITGGGNNETAMFYTKWTDVGALTRDAEVGIRGVTDASALTDWFKLDGVYGHLYTDTIATRAYARSVGGGSSYTDEEAQDAIGAMVDGTLIYTDGTPLLSRAALTGDIEASAGSNTTAIAAGVIVNADINGSAAIDGTKIADGSVTSTEFQYINTLSSNAQTQIDGKANTALSNLASVAINTSLVSDADNTDDLGSSANGWKDIYSRTLKLDGSTSGTVTVNSEALGNALNATTLSGAGYIGVTMFARPTSNFTLANSNTDQNAFSASYDTWTLQGSTLYYFEFDYYITSGAVSHSIATGFTLGGGASVTSIYYNTMVWTATINGPSNTQGTTGINTVASTAINSAGANVTQYCHGWGWIDMNAGGTVVPIIKFSADPTGTCVMTANSSIKFTPVSAGGVQSLGSVN